MTFLIKNFILKIHLILVCHFHIDCWQIGDNFYNCDGYRQCGYEYEG